MHVSDNNDCNPHVLLYKDIFNTGETESWLCAGKEDLESIVLENDTWCPSVLPPGAVPLTTKWVFKKKPRKDMPPRYKARLCVRGFNQRAGFDYTETYAPTAKWVSLRIFLTIAAVKKMTTRQLDVKTAFLYAPLDEELYIKLPDGVGDPDNPFSLCSEVLSRSRGPVLRLKKSLYGLKQAPRNWFLTLRDFLRSHEFNNLYSESCLFVKYVGEYMIILLVFVDDILIAAERNEDVSEIVENFRKRFNITDSGEVNVYLSINVRRDVDSRVMELDQHDYIMQLWKTYNFSENAGVHTPLQELAH